MLDWSLFWKMLQALYAQRINCSVIWPYILANDSQMKSVLTGNPER